MSDSKVTSLDDFKASKRRPSRFGTVAHGPGRVAIDITGEFTPAAARILARHLIERADAAEAEARAKKPKADR